MHDNPSSAEQELIQRCKSGSLKYQEQLYKQFYGYAMGVGLRYCDSRDDALEVVNDSFIKVFNTIQTYNIERSFKAWMRRIIINTSIDRRRKDLKYQLHTDMEYANHIGDNYTAVNQLNAKDILKLMDDLPAIQRTIFNLYEIDGYNHDEIAEMLNIPSSSSRVYLSRAKEKLRKALTTEAHTP
ncbi:RNA polymerase sigma factor [Mucilaginibacter terrae]|uniref:RNA polymerase sigma factor (Sigma-70 family) n=1 Tax=Mucilaginibacter terrae TaxID=1955052 RepID=A0ABU3H0G9_9SPHI|nr:RNA polymerase sigma factor [Mucilaginibacter terrae]MDT3405415.1 RNA polymerase sigma factor (sigma-70 family) [Mucilaginibacter terrae]